LQLYKYLEIEEINRFQGKSTERNSKVAVLEQTHELPFEWLELQLCELFNCLPSQLAHEDYNHLIKLLTLHNAFEEYQSWDKDKGKARLELKKKILKLEAQIENNAI
jgi:hypothetical protein